MTEPTRRWLFADRMQARIEQRAPAEPGYDELCDVIQQRRRLSVELLYGDHEGGQRVVSRFGLSSTRDGSVWLASVGRHWNLDRPDPR